MEKEIAYNIQFENLPRLRDFGAHTPLVNLDFDIEIKQGIF